MFEKDEAEFLRDSLNEKLKAVRNLGDMEKLVLEMENAETHVELVGKRRGYEAYAFSTLPWNQKRAEYLYADGYSVGSARFENLYKVLKFKVWYNEGVVS